MRFAMAMMVLDSFVEQQIRADREARGIDRHDEVWEGVYMMAPIANNEHQELQGRLMFAIGSALGGEGQHHIAAGGNVSDRQDDWTHNYRVPDVIVVFPDSAARDCGTHWCGGPDFTVEITS